MKGCPECKGTGWYVGLNDRDPCSLCTERDHGAVQARVVTETFRLLRETIRQNDVFVGGGLGVLRKPRTLLQQCEANGNVTRYGTPRRFVDGSIRANGDISTLQANHGEDNVYFPIGSYIYSVPWGMLHDLRASAEGDPRLWPWANSTSYSPGRDWRIIEHPTDGRRACVPWRPKIPSQ